MCVLISVFVELRSILVVVPRGQTGLKLEPSLLITQLNAAQFVGIAAHKVCVLVYPWSPYFTATVLLTVCNLSELNRVDAKKKWFSSL